MKNEFIPHSDCPIIIIHIIIIHVAVFFSFLFLLFSHSLILVQDIHNFFPFRAHRKNRKEYKGLKNKSAKPISYSVDLSISTSIFYSYNENIY